jgi:hypothetical protein
MPPPSSPRRRAAPLLPRASRGWFALLLVAAFLASTTTERAHRAAVLHGVCGEHGELVHVATSPAALAALVCVRPCGDEAPTAQPSERSGAVHEHCRLGPLQREPAFQAPQEPGLARSAPPATLGVAPPSIDPPRSEPLLLLAPKQSPPA